MKKILLIIASLACLMLGNIIFFSCEGNQNDNVSHIQTFKQAKGKIEEIKSFLIEEKNWLTKELLFESSKRSISINEIKKGLLKIQSDSDLVIGQIEILSVLYDIKLELMNKNIISMNKFNATSLIQEYGISEDPDQFNWNTTDEEIIVRVLKSDGTYEEVVLKNPDYEREVDYSEPAYPNEDEICEMDPNTAYNINKIKSLEFPLFILTLEEAESPNQMNKHGALQKENSTVHSCLEFAYSNVLRKHDSSDEEFELYLVHDGNINPSDIATSQYGFIEFKGHYYAPFASGIQYYYRNINSSSDTYDPPVPVIQYYDEGYVGLTFIESDYRAMELYKTPNSGSHGYRRKNYYKWLPTGGNGWHNQFYGTMGSSPDNNDDFYTGELLGINTSSVNNAINQGNGFFWLPAYYNGMGQLVTDLKIKFTRGYYNW